MVKLMCVLALCCVAFTGCKSTSGLLAPPAKYRSGENFGDGGKTRCNTVQQVDGRIPFCGFPNDGDGYGMAAGGL